jgi:hypothetical protein
MRVVLSLFDYTGIMGRPWAEAGYTVLCFDLQHPAGECRVEAHGRGCTVFCRWDADAPDSYHSVLASIALAGHHWSDVRMVFGFPPCTDLAASGARHWAAKRAADPGFQDRAAARAQSVERIAAALGRVPYMVENPSGALSRLWRPADCWFNPCDFGGYLPADDQHPTWPEYIPARDAYRKRTGIWCGDGFVMPMPLPVPPAQDYVASNGDRYAKPMMKLGGKSMKTKNIRSATPRGFAEAVFVANQPPRFGQSEATWSYNTNLWRAAP